MERCDIRLMAVEMESPLNGSPPYNRQAVSLLFLVGNAPIMLKKFCYSSDVLILGFQRGKKDLKRRDGRASGQGPSRGGRGRG